MRSRRSPDRAPILLALALIALPLAPARAAEIRDMLGQVSNVTDSPRRVVTLMPSVAEVAAEIVGADTARIVGVSEYTDFPETLRAKASVGPYHKLDLERVVALKPELALASSGGNSKDQIEHLRKLGIPVVVVKTDTLAEIEESFAVIARALGDAPKGARLAEGFRKELGGIRARWRNRGDPRSALIQLGSDPLVVAGKGSFLNEALELVGGRNVFASIAQAYPRPSAEQVLKADPQVVLVIGMATDPKTSQAMAEGWQRFPKLRAVREKRVRILLSEELLRPSSRFLSGMKALEKALHE